MRAISHPETVSRLKPYADVEIIGEARLRAGIGLTHLARSLRTWPAHVVQTALPTSDMIGRTLGRLVGVPAIFSTIRGRNVDKPAWQRWLDRRTAHWAQTIVFNDRDAIPFAMRHEGSVRIRRFTSPTASRRASRSGRCRRCVPNCRPRWMPPS